MRLSHEDVMFTLRKIVNESLGIVHRRTKPRLSKTLKADASIDLTLCDKLIATVVEAVKFTVFDGMSRHNEEPLSWVTALLRLLSMVEGNQPQSRGLGLVGRATS